MVGEEAKSVAVPGLTYRSWQRSYRFGDNSRTSDEAVDGEIAWSQAAAKTLVEAHFGKSERPLPQGRRYCLRKADHPRSALTWCDTGLVELETMKANYL